MKTKELLLESVKDKIWEEKKKYFFFHSVYLQFHCIIFK